MSPVTGNVVQKIKPNWILDIRRVKIRHVFGTRARDVIQYVCRKVSVRVDNSNTSTSLDALRNYIPKKRCFPGSALSYDVEMLPTVGTRKGNRRVLSPHVRHAKNNAISHVPCEPPLRGANAPNDRWILWAAALF